MKKFFIGLVTLLVVHFAVSFVLLAAAAAVGLPLGIVEWVLFEAITLAVAVLAARSAVRKVDQV